MRECEVIFSRALSTTIHSFDVTISPNEIALDTRVADGRRGSRPSSGLGMHGGSGYTPTGGWADRTGRRARRSRRGKKSVCLLRVLRALRGSRFTRSEFLRIRHRICETWQLAPHSSERIETREATWSWVRIFPDALTAMAMGLYRGTTPSGLSTSCGVTGWPAGPRWTG